MSNRIVEVSRQSWGSRIMSSFMGVIFGILLFLGSFIVIWRNEGRTNLADVAQDSIAISAATVDSSADGEMVAASGVLAAAEPLGDPEFLQPGSYLELERNVEIYAWVERSSSNTETNTGGSSTTTTEYTYEKTWTSNPPNSANFKEPTGHENYELTINEASFTASSASVGAYAVDLNQLALPSSQPVALSQANVAADSGFDVVGEYLFLGTGSVQQPAVGDVRISYRAVPSGQDVTVFGKQEGSRIVPYLHRGEDMLYSAHVGTREMGIAAMDAAHRTSTWIFRAVGFLMMWIGLSLILGPISTFLDVLPFLGNLSRGMIRIVTFAFSFVVALIAIIVSAILQSVIGLIIIGLAAVGIAVFFYMRSKNQPPKASIA